MSLQTILVKGVALVDSVIKSVKSDVTLFRMTSHGTDPSYSGGVVLSAAVDYKQHQVRSQAGTMTVSSALVIFTDIPALSSATSGFGVTADDQITLPNGVRYQILAISGFLDPGTATPFATEAHLG